MNTSLIGTITDIEMLIGDLRARMVPEDEFKKKLSCMARSILNNEEAEMIERDLAAGKKVMGQMRNPKTGEDEQMSETGVICQNCGSHWLWGIDCEGKTFICPDCEKFRCGECLEIRLGDDRAEAGMKCAQCAY